MVNFMPIVVILISVWDLINLFSFGDYKDFLNTIDKFLSEQLRAEFKIVDPPKLVISTKWKHDYIIRSRSC